jgi:hypothetical protein
MITSKRLPFYTGFTAILLLAISACTASPTPTPTQDVSPLMTQGALTVIAELTASAPELEPTHTPEPPTPTHIPEPTATQTTEPTATITSTPTSEATPEFRVLIQDDFSAGTGWYTQEADNFGFLYRNNGYAIYVKIFNAWIWSLRGPDNLADVRVEVEAARNAGARDGYYGVMCRQVDEDNYYALVISEDGSYGIGKMEDREFEFLAQGVDSQGAIKTNGDPNRISGDCLGERLVLKVNDVQLLQVEDDDFARGGNGIITATRMTPDFEALFTYFRLSTP